MGGAQGATCCLNLGWLKVGPRVCMRSVYYEIPPKWWKVGVIRVQVGAPKGPCRNIVYTWALKGSLNPYFWRYVCTVPGSML